MARTTTELFLDFSRKKLETQYWPRLRVCVESLTDEQIWSRPNQASNSIGNLLLHLNGNVRQWLVAPFSGLADDRDRPAEFATVGGISGSVLMEKLAVTIAQGLEVIARLTEAELLSDYEIQGYHVTGVHVRYQVIEHFGLHYGQIAYVTKMLLGQDLGFYRELNATGRPGKPGL